MGDVLGFHAGQVVRLLDSTVESVTSSVLPWFGLPRSLPSRQSTSDAPSLAASPSPPRGMTGCASAETPDAVARGRLRGDVMPGAGTIPASARPET